ncbi:hypothetical protein, partial [Pararhizobium sp.]|uniref:hypothetical protein n=1 Tax=Pararhizobium sp. TaxID=1977563 RepID=UPI0027223382
IELGSVSCTGPAMMFSFEHILCRKPPSNYFNNSVGKSCGKNREWGHRARDQFYSVSRRRQRQ